MIHTWGTLNHNFIAITGFETMIVTIPTQVTIKHIRSILYFFCSIYLSIHCSFPFTCPRAACVSVVAISWGTVISCMLVLRVWITYLDEYVILKINSGTNTFQLFYIYYWWNKRLQYFYNLVFIKSPTIDIGVLH